MWLNYAMYIVVNHAAHGAAAATGGLEKMAQPNIEQYPIQRATRGPAETRSRLIVSPLIYRDSDSHFVGCIGSATAGLAGLQFHGWTYPS